MISFIAFLVNNIKKQMGLHIMKRQVGHQMHKKYIMP